MERTRLDIGRNGQSLIPSSEWVIKRMKYGSITECKSIYFGAINNATWVGPETVVFTMPVQLGLRTWIASLSLFQATIQDLYSIAVKIRSNRYLGDTWTYRIPENSGGWLFKPGADLRVTGDRSLLLLVPLQYSSLLLVLFG